MDPSIVKLVKRGTLFIALVVIPILFVDYYVDSYVSFRVTYDEIGRTALGSNYCVGPDIPISERRVKWARVNHMDPVEYMILGSSRSFLFSTDNLGISSFYNLAVSGGSSVKDYMAEIYILYQQDKLPDHVLIEVSPSIFNVNSGEYRWAEWGSSSEYMKELFDGIDAASDDSYLLGVQIKDLLSPSYFRYNLELFNEGKRVYYVENPYWDNENLTTFHVDGSLAYSRLFQTLYDEAEIISQTTTICEDKRIYYCSDFEELDDDLTSDFQRLIQFLKQQGVSIAVYLPPYSEPMYEYICSDEHYSSIPKVEEWILKYGRDNNIQVYGSYDPTNCGLLLSDFYDPYHIKDDKVKDTLWVRDQDAPDVWLKY